MARHQNLTVANLTLTEKSKVTTGVGARNGATVTAEEVGSDVLHKTVLTLANTPMTVRDTEQGNGVKIYDFPAGYIRICGATGTVTITTTSALASTLNASKAVGWGVGTTTQANTTLATTEQDIVNVTSATSSATVNVANTATTGVGPAILAAFDGTVTPVDVYLNLSVPTATDIDGNATVVFNGTITIYWMKL